MSTEIRVKHSVVKSKLDRWTMSAVSPELNKKIVDVYPSRKEAVQRASLIYRSWENAFISQGLDPATITLELDPDENTEAVDVTDDFLAMDQGSDEPKPEAIPEADSEPDEEPEEEDPEPEEAEEADHGHDDVVEDNWQNIETTDASLTDPPGNLAPGDASRASIEAMIERTRREQTEPAHTTGTDMSAAEEPDVEIVDQYYDNSEGKWVIEVRCEIEGKKLHRVMNAFEGDRALKALPDETQVFKYKGKESDHVEFTII